MATAPQATDPFVEQVVRAVDSVVRRDSESAQQERGVEPLHAPTLAAANHWQYVKECIDTGWISSAGAFVERFERELASYTGARHAVAVVNGTCALQVALSLAGVERDDEVIMPSLTFVASANAVAHLGATPHFVDVEPAALSLDVDRLREHLQSTAQVSGGQCFNKRTGRRIAALMPVHVFGHIGNVGGLLELAKQWRLPVIEDAAEALGSWHSGQHAGTFGALAALSFNGNKIISTGGGGAILTNDPALAGRAKHLTTTAKLPHAWEYYHDEVGYNYRLPNLNAALGCAQLEQLPALLARKRKLHERYASAFSKVEGAVLQREPKGSNSNLWLNALVLDPERCGSRDALLTRLNDEGLQSRPIWQPLHDLPMYLEAPRADLSVTQQRVRQVVNVPSSAHLEPEIAQPESGEKG